MHREWVMGAAEAAPLIASVTGCGEHFHVADARARLALPTSRGFVTLDWLCRLRPGRERFDTFKSFVHPLLTSVGETEQFNNASGGLVRTFTDLHDPAAIFHRT